MEKISLTVKGMTCMGCVGAVKNVLTPLSGVADITITLDNGLVVIAFDPALANIDQFKTIIQDAGYEVTNQA